MSRKNKANLPKIGEGGRADSVFFAAGFPEIRDHRSSSGSESDLQGSIGECNRFFHYQYIILNELHCFSLFRV